MLVPNGSELQNSALLPLLHRERGIAEKCHALLHQFAIELRFPKSRIQRWRIQKASRVRRAIAGQMLRRTLRHRRKKRAISREILRPARVRPATVRHSAAPYIGLARK